MEKPLIGIIMGSDSDLPSMQGVADILDDFKVPFEITVVSAHRTPDKMYEYATSAKQRGLKVIIAGAGGSAHLPGMVASMTTLPVIGVPVESKSLKGIDSLYSIVQMPPGVPVATVAINGSVNAGLLALQILAISDEEIGKKLEEYKNNLKQKVANKAEEVENKFK